jgi:hypothetical protein
MGLVCHVLNRSVARLPLLQMPGDFGAFERVLSEAQERYPTGILAYCLMPTKLALRPLAARESGTDRLHTLARKLFQSSMNTVNDPSRQ